MAAAGWLRRTPPISAGSTPRRSRACASEAWPDAAERRRAARCAGLARLPDRGRSRRRTPAGATGWPSLPAQKRVARLELRRRDVCGSPPSGCRSSARCGPMRASSRRSPRRRAYAARDWIAATRRCVEIVRGRLEGPGPGDRRPRSRRRSAWRGRHRRRARGARRPKASRCAAASRRGASEDEWCERRLLARIHRYTVKRLRAEIEPVAARDFLRFLFQLAARRARGAHGGPGGARRGPRRSSKASRRRPAPGRARSCRRGSPTTSRPGSTIGASPARSLDAAALARRPRDGERARRGAGAHDADRAAAAPPCARSGVAVCPQTRRQPSAHGAGRGRFHAAARRVVLRRDASKARGLLRSQVEEALAELVALGLVTPTASAACARCWCPSSRAPAAPAAGAAGASSFGMEDAGRWALARAAADCARRELAIEHVARTLLRRYGVVFWRCSSARPTGCRRGAICCASIAGSKPRRDPRRPLRRRLLRRAVRAARSDRHAARGAAAAARARNGPSSPAPTRSTRRHPDAGPAAARR